MFQVQSIPLENHKVVLLLHLVCKFTLVSKIFIFIYTGLEILYGLLRKKKKQKKEILYTMIIIIFIFLTLAISRIEVGIKGYSSLGMHWF